MKKTKKETVLKYVKNYYDKLEGPEWWQEVENYLRTNYGYPEVYEPPEDMLKDFHPVFRPLIRSIVPPGSEGSMTRMVVMRGRSTLLKARVPPHYVGILDPAFMSRSRNNFGVLGMVPDEKGSFIFSRATLNVPYFWREKIKRLVLGAYGLAKHGRSIEELPDFPSGGVFLLNPDRDPEFDRLTPYNDYHYVTLNVRLPKNYREYIQTLDGSVLISKSAAEKLRYRKVAYLEVMNPVPELRERYMLFKKKGIKVGAEVHFQEPLSIARIGKQELAVNTSPVEGYIYDFKLVTPKIENEARKVYHLTLVGERPAELGCKLESAGGLKHTVAGYVDDREPVVVINPDALKDRSIYWEIKETGRIHVYVTIPGKDGNISNKNARISNTLIQGIFLYPEKVRKKVIEEIFAPENIVINVPENILDIIEDFDINPEKYPVFYPQLYYVRRIEKKTKDGETKVYYNEQLSQFGRAVEALYREAGKILKGTPLSSLPKSLRRKVIDRAYDNLPSFYKQALDAWIKNMAARLIIGDPNKSCQIKIRGWMRLVLFDSKVGVNEIAMSEKLWEDMGKPEYIAFWKEPVTRQESIRCLKVKIDKELKEHPQVVRIHPALGMNYDDKTMRAKVDCDGDLAVLVPIKNCIKELQYPFNREEYKSVKEALKKYRKFEDLPEPEYNYSLKELAKELTCYNRYLTQEAQVIELFGGVKNRAMYTDIIKDTEKWNELCQTYDIELRAMQAEKYSPELKEMDYCGKAEFMAGLVAEGRKALHRLPPRDPFAEEWLRLSSEITFKDRYRIREMIKTLKKQKHPVLQLYWKIYENSPLKI